MKRAIFIIVLVTGFIYVSKAQLTIKPGIGMNWTKLSSDHANWTSEGRLGFQAGATLKYGEKFYIEPGVFWVRTTKDLVEVDDPNEEAFKSHINAIRIPVLFGYNILGDRETLASLRAFIGAGGTIVTGVKSDTDDLSKDDFNSFLVDLDAGLGVDVWIFYYEVHYVNGFTKVFKEDSDGKLRGFFTNLGVRIRL